MKKLLLVALLSMSLSVSAQTYDLTRSIITADVRNLSLSLTTYDTASSSVLDNYTHTGTMRITNNVATFDTFACLEGACVTEHKDREIMTVFDDGKRVALKDDDVFPGAILFTILSLEPYITLMRTYDDGTVQITEWTPRN